jgi:hypothetical protein
MVPLLFFKGEMPPFAGIQSNCNAMSGKPGNLHALGSVLLSARIVFLMIDFIDLIQDFGYSNLFRISDLGFRISWLRLRRARVSAGRTASGKP